MFPELCSLPGALLHSRRTSGIPRSMDPLHRIVLTGGPCGGKTTLLAAVRERLASHGFRVYLVPEVATLLALGGVPLGGNTPEQLALLEASILQAQMALEDAFRSAAAAGTGPAVILCDRGTMDVSAYLPPATWQALLKQRGWSAVELRDSRYEAVIHLVTAADGAEAFYGTANNAARWETPEQARALDQRLRDAWLGHPHFRVVDNSSDFAGKIRRALQAVSRVTGIPEPVEVERKYLVRHCPEPLPVPHEEVEIDQDYLQTSDGSEARVRRRGQHGVYLYTHTVKKPLAAGQRIEIERPISGREYAELLRLKDPQRRTIRKRRSCFLWQGLYFELDRFLEPRAGLELLEIELDDEAAPIPPTALAGDRARRDRR